MNRERRRERWCGQRWCGQRREYRRRQGRRGFTLLEILASTILLAIVVISVVALSSSISSQRMRVQDTVYLSTHNLNCMERLRQMAVNPTFGGGSSTTLAAYYGPDVFGNSYIDTKVYVETSSITGAEQFHIYRVEIHSQMLDTSERLNSVYILTDIGTVEYTTIVE